MAKKNLLIVFIVTVVAILCSCAPNQRILELSPEARARMLKVQVVEGNPLSEGSYDTLGTVTGLSCNSNAASRLGTNSIDEVKAEASGLGADAVINVVCGYTGMDWANNCNNAHKCVGDAVKMKSSDYVSLYNPTKTQAQNRTEYMTNKLEHSGKNYAACYDAVLASEEGVRLNEKYVFTQKDSRLFEKSRIKEYATEQDKSDLLAYRRMIHPCMEKHGDQLREADARIANVFSSFTPVYDENLSRLIDGDISIGEYNKNNSTIYNSREEAWEKKTKEINEELERQHYAEMEQREAERERRGKEGTALMNMYMQGKANKEQQRLQQQQLQQQLQQQQQQQQQQLNMNKSTNTNCTFVGNSVSCTSY